MSGEFQELIKAVLESQDSAATRSKFLDVFGAELSPFSGYMDNAFEAWVDLHSKLESNVRGAHTSALVYGALNSHVVAMRLFLEGLIVPAGNTQRYVLESIAMSFLIASRKHSFYERFVEGKYTTNNAIRDLKRKAGELGVTKEGARQISEHASFYDQYSHPSLLSAASLMTLDQDNPQTIFGSAFDEAKVDAYSKEITSRVNLAAIFPNFIRGVGEIYERVA